MRKSRFSEEQIIGILRKQEAGSGVMWGRPFRRPLQLVSELGVEALAIAVAESKFALRGLLARPAKAN